MTTSNLETTTGTERLAALVSAKCQLVEMAARLARRQLEFIEAGEMTSLLKLLAGKQVVLQRLQELDRQLEPFRAQTPESRVWRSAAERTACQSDAERCNALLAEAMELEKQGEAAMVRRRDAAAAGLAGAHSAADARVGYTAAGTGRAAELQMEG
jgi:hypothetical protein